MDEFIQRELDKKYRNTHAALINRTDQNEQHVVYIMEIGGDRFAVSASTPTGWKRSNFPVNEYRLMTPIKKRLFNFGGLTFKYSHRPERQWQVGLSENNSDIFSLEEGMAHARELLVADVNVTGNMHVWRNHDVSPFTDLFIPNNARTIAEAVAHIKATGHTSKVVRKSWSVMLGNDDCYMLWYYDFLVAMIDFNKRTCKILNTLFRQEVSDLFYRTGEFYECK